MVLYVSMEGVCFFGMGGLIFEWGRWPHGGHQFWCGKGIVCIGLSPTPLSLSCQAPLKSTNCPSPPFLRNSPPIYWFSLIPPKVGSFSEPQKYESSLSLIPSYLLKVTKFLHKISQFEFLVMSEKNIFGYEFFCH